MYKRLLTESKIRLIKRVQAGEPIAKVCREAGVSRTIFYKWQRKYLQAAPRAKKKVLESRVVRGKKHWKRLDTKIERKILKTILENPSLSPQKISPIVGISPHGVWDVLKRNGLNTQSDREAYLYQYGLSLIKPPTVDDKLTAIRRFEAGEKVAYICREFGISRTTFYKWFKRYQEAPEEKKREILLSWRPKEEKHWRFVPGAKELVLKIVVECPELSPQKISQRLPLKKGKPILSSHGVWNLLKKLNLNTYEMRLAYAQVQAPVITPAFGLPESIRRVIGKIPIVSAIPPPTREKIASVLRAFVFSFLTSVIFSIVFIFGLQMLSQAPTFGAKLGLLCATLALTVGSLFFAYSMKYYLTLAIVLSFSRQPLEEGGGYAVGLNGRLNGNQRNGNGGNWLQRIFGLGNGNGERRAMIQAGGLQPSLDHIKLKQYPFVSIHLPFYNEKKVAGRILKACASFDYPNYEIIVCDDSTDETIEIVQRYAKRHNQYHLNGPYIKVLHRPTREGFKGGALAYALQHVDPKTEFVVVFDADFIPYPDTLQLFLKYFKVNNQGSEDYTKSKVACVAGYQWHVLNKSENWVTRGVRTEYSGSYVIERSGQEILGAMKLIHGSVYCIRADILKKFGWGTSITEDFQLSLKLYEQGYKVIYTPYIQAPAECVSTLKRLIGQRMRWAEGHSHCVKKMFFRLLKTPHMTSTEKLEFLYLSPYYLQAFFFLVGTFSWLMTETVFRARLPFWTSLWGWSLVLTNFLSLPLVNAVGLFLEESERKDYIGLLSFIFLSYLLVPFQAYASVKGFLEREEGPWFRTPKTGLITDIFTRGRFYRWISGIIPRRGVAPVVIQSRIVNPYLALTTANNQFNNFQIAKKRVPWLVKSALAILLALTTTLMYFSRNVQVVYADTWASPLQLTTLTGETGTSFPAWGNWLTNLNSYGTGGQFKVMRNANANLTTNNYFWLSNFWPNGASNARIPPGNYYVQFAKKGNGTIGGGNVMNIGMQLLLTNNNGTTRRPLAINTYKINQSNASNTLWTFSIGNLVGNNITNAARNRLALRIFIRNGQNLTNAQMYWNILMNNSNAPARLVIPAAGITVPEIPKPIVMIILMVIIPVMPTLVSGRLRRPGQNIFQEFALAWKDLIRQLTGIGEEALDRLPV